MENNSKAKTVFINPNFKQTHINPNFIKITNTSNIHINPAFLGSYCTNNISSSSKNNLNKEPEAKIISKSKTKLIRDPKSIPRPNNSIPNPLVKIGLRKLVRTSTNQKKSFQTPKILPTTKYIAKNGTKSKNKAFVSKYALKRCGAVNETFRMKKVVLSYKLRKNMHKRPFLNSNNKVEILAINGVYYKSTKNKLRKTNPVTTFKTKSTKNSTLFIRGDKYLLNNNGLELIKADAYKSNNILKRIHFGGYTYIAKSNNIFVRTDSHKARSYVSNAKYKSIQHLSKKLKKSNISCPIFRKIGKCAAFDRGKCPNIHDKKQIAICPKFLKGECITANCLLSHEITLSKMPTCKFFLQGSCVREDCPYLHKKHNSKTEICLEFLKGFCILAEKCNRRHEFMCPDQEKTGKCEITRCQYPHKIESNNTKCKTHTQNNASILEKEIEDNVENSSCKKPRYFVKDSNNHKYVCTVSNLETNKEQDPKEANKTIPKREKIVGSLPAYIPL